MSRSFVLSVDQSTQGTKAVLFAEDGTVVAKTARPHTQIVNELGWVSHDPEEIMTNVLAVCRDVCKRAGVRPGEVKAFGISNQRETCLAWDRETREPLADAVVWQCGRAKGVCDQLAASREGMARRVKELSGMDLSPYFSASKMAWLLRNQPAVQEAADRGTLCLGTIDSWLVFKLSEEHAFLTEPSNACRTQLLDLHAGAWSNELCDYFGVPRRALATVVPSDSVFGHTTLGGLFPDAVPICGVLGDSQAALAAQNCLEMGDTKATYGTGSSVMMQTGPEVVESQNGLVSSIAWDFGGKRSYVLEGNLNYTGAVITWLKDQMGLISDPGEVEAVIAKANPADRAYFVPAFTGLGGSRASPAPPAGRRWSRPAPSAFPTRWWTWWRPCAQTPALRWGSSAWTAAPPATRTSCRCRPTWPTHPWWSPAWRSSPRRVPLSWRAAPRACGRPTRFTTA